jgi:hypothetical protein
MSLPTVSYKAIKKPPSTHQTYEKKKQEAVEHRDNAKGTGEWSKKQTSKKKKQKQGEDEDDDLVKGMGKLSTNEEAMAPIKLPWFDPEKIMDDACIVAFGKRRTGKTWIVRNLLHLKRGVFNHGLVITKTKFNGFWQNYFPMAVVHGDYDPKILEAFMKLQLNILSENEKNPNKQINPWAVIVLDDVIADKHVRYCDTLATLFYNGRHFRIMLIVCSQYVFGLPPGLRSNVDYAFVLRQAQKRQRDQLAEDYADMVYDKDYFFNMLDTNTQDQHAMVVDLSDPNIPPEEMFWQWKAEDVPLFEIGSLPWKKKVWLDGEEKMKEHYTMS